MVDAEELAVDTSIEAILVAEERIDEFSIDPYIELAVLAAELAVDTSIEAILVAEERLTKKLRDPSSNPVRIKTYIRQKHNP